MCSSKRTPFARNAAAKASAFSTLTVASSHVCQTKHGGVSVFTCFSLDKSSINSGDGFSPNRFLRDPPWVASVIVMTA